jgi:putative aldouronate transport system substrate-binding protein
VTTKYTPLGLPLNRRTVLQGGVAALALAAISPILTACAPGSPTSTAVGAGAGLLPNYVPYTGVKPDIAGVPGTVEDLFLTYPASPLKAIADIPGDGKPLTVLTLAEVAPPALDQNPFWQELNKRLGVDYQPSFAPAADYATKFATVTAGDSLPDMFTILPATPALPQFLGAKAADLTEHLAGDAIEKYPFLANLPTASWQGTLFNGRISAIPIPRGITTTWIMYARRDLLKAKGVDGDPTSYDDFVSQLEAFTDPAANKWALASVPLNYIRQMLKVPNIWKLDGGKFTTAYSADEQGDALEATRKIVAAGHVTPDAAGLADSLQKKYFVNGTSAFGWFTESGYASLGTDATKAVPDYEGSGMTVPGFSSGTGTVHLGDPNHSIVGISKKNQDRIPTILAVANYLASAFGTEEYLFRKYGLPDVHYTIKDGSIASVSATAPQKGLGQAYMADSPGILFAAGPLKDLVTRQQEFEKAFTTDAVANPAYGLFSNTQSRSGASLDAEMKALELDIVLGRKPVSAWDDGVKNYLSKGGKKIQDELSEEYSKLN